MPQKPVRRRAGNRYTPAPRPAFKPRLVAEWAGWDAAVLAMIEERGPGGTRAFGEGQADNYRWILQGYRNRQWREENAILAPEDVTPERVERLKQDLLGEAEMRPASVQQYIKNLKTFLRWCRSTGFGIDDAALEVANVDLGDGEPPDPFSEEEIAALEAAAPTPARRLFIRFAWRTGLRVSEIERANIEDVGRDSHGPVLHVPSRRPSPAGGGGWCRSIPNPPASAWRSAATSSTTAAPPTSTPTTPRAPLTRPRRSSSTRTARGGGRRASSPSCGAWEVRPEWSIPTSIASGTRSGPGAPVGG